MNSFIKCSDMYLSYTGKKSEKDILRNTEPAQLSSAVESNEESTLIQGENLSILAAILRTYKGKVDLIYIDPPFATNLEFRMSGTRARSVSSSGEILAYSDTLNGEDYFEFIRERLVFLRELLSETGSIYFHIDYKIGHYVKVLMDEIFGKDNFRNDLTRIKCNPKNFNRKAFGNIKDLILFYSKSNKMTWNDPREPHSAEDIQRLFKKTDKNGRRYTTTPLHAPGETSNGSTGNKWRGIKPPEGRHWRVSPNVLEEWERDGKIEWSETGNPRKIVYFDESQGKKVQDIWEYKDPAYSSYPTQKNLDLLKRIIATSTNEGDLVLDCFCGSGTTLIASEELGRQWIGIDESQVAIKVCQERLSEVGSSYNLKYDNRAEIPQTVSLSPRQYSLLLEKSNGRPPIPRD